MAEMTSPEALALSAHNSQQAKKNQHHPRLGPGGYVGKQEQFRKMDQEAKASKNKKVVRLKPRIRQWIYARGVDGSGSSLKFAKPETAQR
jgi:anti-sigma28 factor (negative regulator of flagellin synthesis)